MTRIARLDGMRATAFLLVFAVHALYFAPGWTGVDLFFTLSGYLITGILRRDRESEEFWLSFYIKRGARILPPLIIFFVFAAFLVDIPWRHIGLYYIFFAANIAEAMVPKQGKEISILWSLAVEEHFYLFWPFAVRTLSRVRLIQLLVIILVVEPVARGLATPLFHDSWSIYVLTPFRLDSLAAGSLLSLVLEDPTSAATAKRYSAIVAFAALFMFTVTSLIPTFRPDWHSLWFNVLGYTAVAFMAVAWLNYTVHCEACWLSRILGTRAFAFIGLLSYGAYLYHELVLRAMQIVLVKIGYNHMRTVLPITSLLVLLVSWISYKFYELPIMKKSRQLVPAIGKG